MCCRIDADSHRENNNSAGFSYILQSFWADLPRKITSTAAIAMALKQNQLESLPFAKVPFCLGVPPTPLFYMRKCFLQLLGNLS